MRFGERCEPQPCCRQAVGVVGEGSPGGCWLLVCGSGSVPAVGGLWLRGAAVRVLVLPLAPQTQVGMPGRSLALDSPLVFPTVP